MPRLTKHHEYAAQDFATAKRFARIDTEPSKAMAASLLRSALRWRDMYR